MNYECRASPCNGTATPPGLFVYIMPRALRTIYKHIIIWYILDHTPRQSRPRLAIIVITSQQYIYGGKHRTRPH